MKNLLIFSLLFSLVAHADTPPPLNITKLRGGPVNGIIKTVGQVVSALNCGASTGYVPTWTGTDFTCQALPASGVTSVTASSPLFSSGGATPNLTIQFANSTQAGALSAADWNTFNGKQDFITAGTSAQYYRGDKTMQTLNTTAVPEGSNLYYTAARFDTAFAGKTTTNLAEGSNLYYTSARFNTAFAAKSTTDLAEGTNLYFTNGRAQSAISATSPLTYALGVLGCQTASGSQAGCLSSSDWSTFNGKQSALVFSSPLVNTSGTVSIPVATSSANGYLSSSDWTLFNSKQPGFTPGTISTSTTGVTVGSGTSSTVGPNVTVNVQTASGSQPGLLSSADWTTFNSKQSALTFSSPLVNTSGTISIPVATSLVNGYLSSSDWSLFNAKQSALTFGSISTSTTGVTVGSGSNSTVGPAVTVNVQTSTDVQPGLLSAADHSDLTLNTASRHNAVTIGTANGLSLATQALSLAAATDSVPGAMTAADHTTFTANTATLAAATSSATALTLAKRNASGQIPYDSLGSLPNAQVWYVDKNRTDTYTADGSFDRPYLTIQAAINAIAAAGLNSLSHPDQVTVVGPGTYAENVTMNSSALFWVGLIAANPGMVSITSFASTSNNTQLQLLYMQGISVNSTFTMTGDINNTNFCASECAMRDVLLGGAVSITNTGSAYFYGPLFLSTITMENSFLQILGGQGQAPTSSLTVTNDNAHNKPNGFGAASTAATIEQTLTGRLITTAGTTVTCRKSTRVGATSGTSTIAGTLTDAGCQYLTNMTISSGGVWTPTDSSYTGTLTNSGTITMAGTLLANAMVGDSGSGGKRGLVPAPAAGDAAANKFLKADGTYAQPSGGSALGTSLLYYGDGSDGALTVTATNTTSGPISAGSLTRDAYFSTLTFTGVGSFKTAGYRVFVNNTLDVTAAGSKAINCDGNAGVAATTATGAAAPTAQAANSVGTDTTGTAGGTGSTTTGAQAAAPTNASPANGGASGTSGAGGLGSSGAGGVTRAGATVTNALTIRRQGYDLWRGTSLLVGGAGGPGGGGGGGDGTAGAGGGSGGNGGTVCYVAANIINRGASTAAGTISAKGGAGGNGFTAPAGSRGGGGGGSAGGGGWIYLVNDTLQGSSATNMLDASGGTGGTGGNALGTGVGGNGGSGGAGGRVTTFSSSLATGSETFGSAGTTGTAATLLVGGAGGAGNTVQVSF